MSKFKNYIMKTLKTILLIALFSMVTISCTDLTEEDELMQNPPIENVVNSSTTDTNTPPPPPPPPPNDGTGSDTPGTGNDEGSGDGTGKGN
jgi:hypothetical protein